MLIEKISSTINRIASFSEKIDTIRAPLSERSMLRVFSIACAIPILMLIFVATYWLTRNQGSEEWNMQQEPLLRSLSHTSSVVAGDGSWSVIASRRAGNGGEKAEGNLKNYMKEELFLREAEEIALSAGGYDAERTEYDALYFWLPDIADFIVLYVWPNWYKWAYLELKKRNILPETCKRNNNDLYCEWVDWFSDHAIRETRGISSISINEHWFINKTTNSFFTIKKISSNKIRVSKRSESK